MARHRESRFGWKIAWLRLLCPIIMKISNELPVGASCPTVATNGSQPHSAGRELLYADTERGVTAGYGIGDRAARTEAYPSYLTTIPARPEPGNAICSIRNHDGRATYPQTAPPRRARRPDPAAPGAWG